MTNVLVAFGPVTIEARGAVLTPRPWTFAQSMWAADVAATSPPGPLLELCCGAGQIGLAAAQLSGRTLVQVDRDGVACRLARRNAARNRIVTDVRHAPMENALSDDERFAVVIADPPYLRTAEVGRYPRDPPGAIDGGEDGLVLVGVCLDVAARHTEAGASMLLQLRGPAQVRAVAALVAERGCPFAIEGARAVSHERAVMWLRRSPDHLVEFLDPLAG